MYRPTIQRVNTALMIHKKHLSGNATHLLATTTKRSGLQKQVFALYRKLLRTSNAKDNDTAAASTSAASLQGRKDQDQQQPSILKYLSDPKSTTFATQKQFRNKASQLKRRDVDRIEYNIRQGEKYLNLLQMSGVTSVRRSSAAWLSELHEWFGRKIIDCRISVSSIHVVYCTSSINLWDQIEFIWYIKKIISEKVVTIINVFPYFQTEGRNPEINRYIQIWRTRSEHPFTFWNSYNRRIETDCRDSVIYI